MKSLRTITREALDSFVPMTMNSIHDGQFNIKRKIILSIVCFAFFGMMPLYAQLASAVLHHQGTITSYSPGHFSDALTSAEEGDTLYISEGIVAEDITILSGIKGLTIIGAGVNTHIAGTLKLSYISSPTTIKNLDIQGDLSFYFANTTVTVSQCQVGGGVTFEGSNTCLVNIDRCYIKGFSLVDNYYEVNVFNCKIEQISGSSSAEKITFTNCDIKQLINIDATDASCTATYVNSIIGGFASNGFNSSTVFMNCLMKADDDLKIYIDQTITQNCWYKNDEVLNDDFNYLFNLNDYIGTDDTFIGINGGAAPYSLTPAVPRITNHTITVDSSAKKLNVTLTIGN